MTALLEVDAVSKHYSGRRQGRVVALRDVSFSVGTGEVVGLLGPNGAGKTTLIKTICGLIEPTSGQVRISGTDIAAQRTRAARHVVALLEGSRTVYWRLTVRENLEYFASLRGVGRRAVAARVAGFIERFSLAAKTDVPALGLSRGMQQRLAVACACVVPVPLLLLDEPTLGLDIESAMELRGYLAQLARDEGLTLLISSHDMGMIEQLCRRVIVINGGAVATDAAVETLLDAFRTRGYALTFSEPPTSGLRAAIEARYRVVGDPRRADETMTIAVSDREGLFDLMDLLKTLDAPLDTIERTHADLESVFLSLVASPAGP